MAARKTSVLPTRIWKFPARVAQADEPRVRDLLLACSRYYNRLVAIEAERVAQFNEIRRRHVPELAEAESRRAALQAQIDAVYREIRQQRQEHFSSTAGQRRRVLPPDALEHVARLKGELRDIDDAAKIHRDAFSRLLAPAREEAKRRATQRAAGGGPRILGAAKSAVLAEMLAEPEWSLAWKEVARSDDLAHTALRTARKSCALPAGTYLGVEDAFFRACASSAPRAPRFRQFGGCGKLQVQLHAKTFAALLAGAPACTIRSVEHDPDRKGAQSRMFVVQMNQSLPRGQRQFITLTFKMHREVPGDASVKWVAAIVRRLGTRVLVEVQFTLEHASFARHALAGGGGVTEHITLGWAAVAGGIRIAQWAAGDVVIPDSILGQHEHAIAIRAAADHHYNTAKRLLRRALRRGSHDLTGWDRMTPGAAGAVLRNACRAFARFVLGDGALGLWRAWVAHRRSRGEDLYAMPHVMRSWLGSRGLHDARQVFAFWCGAWARKDAHLRQYAIDSERRFMHRREAFMRAEATRIACAFDAITIDDFDIAALKRRPTLSMPGTIPSERGQHQLQAAAPGRFRDLVCETMGPRCVRRMRSGEERSSMRTRRKAVSVSSQG